MESRIANRSSANRNRRQHRDRRKFSGTADLYPDVFKFRDPRTRGVLVSDGPARRLTGESEFILQCGAIHFDDDAIYLVGKRVALPFPLLNERPDLVHGMNEFAVLIDLESRLLQSCQS